MPAWGWFATWLVGMSALVLLAGQWIVPRVQAREQATDERLLGELHGAIAPLVTRPLNLTVIGRRVLLEGDVSTEAEREAIVAAARDREGVVGVDDSLVVVGPPPGTAGPAPTDARPLPAPEPEPDGPDPDVAPVPDAPAPDEPLAGAPLPPDEPAADRLTLVDEGGEALLSDEEALALAAPPPEAPPEPDPDAPAAGAPDVDAFGGAPEPDSGPEPFPEPEPEPEPAPFAAPEPKVVEAPAPPAPARPASLSVRVADGALTLSGSVAESDAERLARFAEPATEAFDPSYVENTVQTAPDVAPAPWLESLERLLVPLAGLDSPGVEIDATRLAVSGTAPSPAVRTALLDAAAELFPDRALDDRTALGTAAPDGAAATGAPALADAPPGERADAPAADGGERRRALREAFDAMPARPILFESGTARFAGESAARVDEIAALLLEHPGVRVEIEGHTDASGPARDNLALSQRRANAVRDALVAAGVPRDRLVAYGYGEGVPLVDNSTPEGRAQNRRIEFRF